MNLLRKKISGTVVIVVLLFDLRPLGVAADGKELFAKQCASCHGPDGKAQTPIARKLGVKDLTQTKLTEAEIEKQIVEGKRDDHGKEKMPSFKGKLSADEIKSLINTVKELGK